MLALGEKAIELRKWNTKLSGEFLVHTSKNVDVDACKRLDINIDNLSIGAIIGSEFYTMSKCILIKKILTEINKKIFLLFPNILMVTNMDF